MENEPLRVYLIEDSPPVLNLLEELVETAGATVVGHADTASAAVSDIASLHPDAVIIDIALRIGSGFDVLEAMAINDEIASPVPIVLTNHASDAFRNAAVNLGVRYFFDKSKEIDRAFDLLSHPDTIRGRQLAA
jgi:DNA-binding NarL/FixJ family response regulator